MKKRHLTLKKLQQKVSQLFFVALGILNNILKVYQNLTKVLFVSNPMFLGPRNPLNLSLKLQRYN